MNSANADNALDHVDNAAGQPDWQNRLRTHAGNVPEIVVSLCDAFLQEVPSLLTKIRRSLQGGDHSQLTNSIHTLKSCLAYVAPESQIQIAAELENKSRSAESVADQSFVKEFDQLESIARQWITKIEAMRAEIKASGDRVN
ncbi:MAG: Hpt domain-containing protein [Pirellulaceae bacterium]|nr:Hpt domain-containing protein [Pirellulaceae bacterium]